MIKRVAFTFIITLFFFILGSSEAQASIVSVGKDGRITWKVLSKQDNSGVNTPTHSYIEVKKVQEADVVSNSAIELSKNDGKINLYVSDGNETRQINVTEENGDLVEIEERAEIQKINIGVRNDKFSLKQRGYFALTEYPIKIDPKTAKLTVGTKSGDRFLSILPYEAVQGVLRTKLISRVNDNLLEIVEEGSELQYAFSGEKVFNIFDFYEYVIPVFLKVSATTGETVSIEGPTWYKIIGFFLS